MQNVSFLISNQHKYKTAKGPKKKKCKDKRGNDIGVKNVISCDKHLLFINAINYKAIHISYPTSTLRLMYHNTCIWHCITHSFFSRSKKKCTLACRYSKTYCANLRLYLNIRVNICFQSEKSNTFILLLK